MSTESSTGPIVGSHAIYHKNLKEIDEIIVDLQEYSTLFTPEHKNKLRNLVGSNEPAQMTVDDVQQQYELVKRIRDQIVDGSAILREGTDVRSLTSFVSASNSLISLFLKNQQTFNHIKESEDLKEAVLWALRDLEPAIHTRFFNKLDELSTKKV